MKRLLAGTVIVVLSLFVLSSSTVLAQDACEGNFDCDGDVDGTDAAVFKTDFGRSAFKNPCPDCTSAGDPPAPVPQTGVTGCWDDNGDPMICAVCIPDCTIVHGQDGAWGKGVELPDPRFTVNGDGTVRDNLTGLIWLQNANCLGSPVGWMYAIGFADDLHDPQCGLTDGSIAGDWRIPNIKELLSLVDYSEFNPVITNSGYLIFWDIVSSQEENSYYWSSTGFAVLNRAWALDMRTGEAGFRYKTNIETVSYVWPVRGPE